MSSRFPREFRDAILIAVVSFSAVGCSCGGGAPTDAVSSKVKDDLSNANDLARKVNGDYKKLAPNERQIFLQMANNDETQAAKIVDMMAHPPNAGVAAAHAHTGGN